MLILKLLMNGVLITLTVLMAFYAAYKDSADFESLAENGIWRAAYCWTSRIGYACYKTDRFVYGLIMRRAEQGYEKGSKIYMVLNAIVSVVISYTCLRIILSIYDLVLGFLFTGDEAVNITEGVLDHTIYSMINSVIAIICIIKNLTGATGGLEFFVALIITIVKLAVFVAFHILFFSVLFGYLKHKVKIFDLSAKWMAWKKDVDSDEKNAKKDFVELIKNWWYDTTSENPILIVMAYKQNFIVLIITAVLLGPMLGGLVGGSWLDLIATALDAVDLVNIVVSFAISWILAKIASKAGTEIGKHLPEEMQEKLHEVSVKLNIEVDAEYEKREDWAEEQDDEFFSVQCEMDESLMEEELPDEPQTPHPRLIRYVDRMVFTDEERAEELEKLRAYVAEAGYDTHDLSLEQLDEIIRNDGARYEREWAEYKEALTEYRRALRKGKAWKARNIYESL